MKAIAGISWGAHPITLLRVYKGYIRSVLDWGGVVLEGSTPAQSHILDRIQFAALRVVLGLMCTTPTNVILDQTAEWPLADRRSYLLTKFLISSFSRFQCNFAATIRLWYTEFYGTHDFLEPPLPPPPPAYSLTHPRAATIRPATCAGRNFFLAALHRNSSDYTRLSGSPLGGYLDYPYHLFHYTPSVDLLTFTNIGHYKHRVGNYYYHGSRKLSQEGITRRVNAALHQLAFHHILYTDGSLLPDGSGGYGVYSAAPEIRDAIPCQPHSSIFSLEAQAILRALEHVTDLPPGRIGILSDSRSVLHAVASPDLSGRKPDLIYRIRFATWKAQQRGYHITYLWTPGHRGIFGNEQADALARLGALSSEPPLYHQIIPDDLIINYKKRHKETAHRHLDHQFTFKGLRYRSHLEQLSSKPWFHLYSSSPRHILTLMARIRSYHITTGVHLMEKEITPTADCQCGIEWRDWQHILFDCPLHQEQSDRLRLALDRCDFPPTADIYEEAFKNSRRVFPQIHRFLRLTNQSL